MKAIRCKKFGPPADLILEELPSLTPGPNEVVVTIKACGINFPDTLIIQGLYQFKPELPFTPGSDIAGIVKAVGDKVTHFLIGDEVFGFVSIGGFAEEVAVPAAACFLKSPKMSFPVAASFMVAYGTAYHALKDRAKLVEGETLLVLGAAGGVGLAAVELAKLMGANVIAVASTEEKLRLCREYGADHTINYAKEDLKAAMKQLTGNRGADVIYDPVGGTYSETALRGIAYDGRYLVVGFASGTIPKIPLNLPLLKTASIVGVFWGDFAMRNPKQNLQNTRTLLEWYEAGNLRPHLHKVYKLKEVAKALDSIIERKVQGKVVLEV